MANLKNTASIDSITLDSVEVLHENNLDLSAQSTSTPLNFILDVNSLITTASELAIKKSMAEYGFKYVYFDTFTSTPKYSTSSNLTYQALSNANHRGLRLNSHTSSSYIELTSIQNNTLSNVSPGSPFNLSSNIIYPDGTINTLAGLLGVVRSGYNSDVLPITLGSTWSLSVPTGFDSGQVVNALNSGAGFFWYENGSKTFNWGRVYNGSIYPKKSDSYTTVTWNYSDSYRSGNRIYARNSGYSWTIFDQSNISTPIATIAWGYPTSDIPQFLVSNDTGTKFITYTTSGRINEYATTTPWTIDWVDDLVQSIPLEVGVGGGPSNLFMLTDGMLAGGGRHFIYGSNCTITNIVNGKIPLAGRVIFNSSISHNTILEGKYGNGYTMGARYNSINRSLYARVSGYTPSLNDGGRITSLIYDCSFRAPNSAEGDYFLSSNTLYFLSSHTNTYTVSKTNVIDYDYINNVYLDTSRNIRFMTNDNIVFNVPNALSITYGSGFVNGFGINFYAILRPGGIIDYRDTFGSVLSSININESNAKRIHFANNRLYVTTTNPGTVRDVYFGTIPASTTYSTSGSATYDADLSLDFPTLPAKGYIFVNADILAGTNISFTLRDSLNNTLTIPSSSFNTEFNITNITNMNLDIIVNFTSNGSTTALLKDFAIYFE